MLHQVGEAQQSPKAIIARPSMRFSKMHGLGNDYVVIDCISAGLSLTERSLPRLARGTR
jgi:hypothetical protein